MIHRHTGQVMNIIDIMNLCLYDYFMRFKLDRNHAMTRDFDAYILGIEEHRIAYQKLQSDNNVSIMSDFEYYKTRRDYMKRLTDKYHLMDRFLKRHKPEITQGLVNPDDTYVIYPSINPSASRNIHGDQLYCVRKMNAIRAQRLSCKPAAP